MIYRLVFTILISSYVLVLSLSYTRSSNAEKDSNIIDSSFQKSKPNNSLTAEEIDRSSSNLSFTNIWENLPANTGGHGVFFGDVDNDGLTDLYLTLIKNIGPEPDLFLRNLGKGHFVEEAKARGIDDSKDGGSHGAVWADLDNDGDLDLINGGTITAGFGNNESEIGASNDIYENRNGKFINVTPSALLKRKEKTRAIITLDWDNDGDLDIYAIQGNMSDSPEVYRNEGGFEFTEIKSGTLANSKGQQGAIDTDYDSDGDIDIFTANRNGKVNILINDGKGNFSPVDPSSIGILHTAGDGITTADVNNDGKLDLLLTSDNSGHLYLNKGKGMFTHKQSFSGTDGYMGGFGDVDNDCDLDLIFAGDNKVYLNDEAGNFSQGPFIPVTTIDPRAIAFSDIDNDGDIDFAVTAKNSSNNLIRNNYNRGNWLKVKLISPKGQIGAFGSRVFIYTCTNRKLLGMREAKSNYGYLSQDDTTLHFGLGKYECVYLVTKFVNGTEIIKNNLSPNQTILINANINHKKQ